MLHSVFIPCQQNASKYSIIASPGLSLYCGTSFSILAACPNSKAADILWKTTPSQQPREHWQTFSTIQSWHQNRELRQRMSRLGFSTKKTTMLVLLLESVSVGSRQDLHYQRPQPEPRVPVDLIRMALHHILSRRSGRAGSRTERSAFCQTCLTGDSQREDRRQTQHKY